MEVGGSRESSCLLSLSSLPKPLNKRRPKSILILLTITRLYLPNNLNVVMSSAALEHDNNLHELQLAKDNFEKTLPKVSNVSKLLTNELNLIETKEKQLGERFKSQLDEYKKVS